MSIRIALAGNPNSGKTTLFNALTGSSQYVGNWPGVTVERKTGKLKINKEITLVDLPGIYSLSPYTLEEVITRNYIATEKPDAIINIVDASNIERNLYLTTQLVELGIPVVIALNMMDIVNKRGDKIDIAKLSKDLGCPVFECSAAKQTGINEVAEAAIKAANGAKAPEINHRFPEAVETAFANIEKLSSSYVKDGIPSWNAIKLFERDEKIIEALALPENVSAEIETEIVKAEEALDDDSESIITNHRYSYIEKVIKDSVKKANAGQLTISDKIDKIVTNRILALPIFAVVMFLVYYLSISTVGTMATDWVNDGVFGDGFHLFGIGSGEFEDATAAFDEATAVVEANEAGEAAVDIENEDGEVEKTIEITPDVLADAQATVEEEPDPANYGVWVPGIPALVETGLDNAGAQDWLKSLILDGIIGGVGAVLGFLPQMLVLFILLAILEECGYMARIAFIMDRIFRKFGLSGKSFIPILIGTGCGVPGIMASRTIENDRDRKMTVIVTTFIPCGAKLPIIGLIAGAIFPEQWWLGPSAYFAGILAIIISGIMLKKFKLFAGDPAPFVMELPQYHAPRFVSVMKYMLEKGWAFIKRAGTIIFVSCGLIWFLQSFNWQMQYIEDQNVSMLADVGKAIDPVFAPLGWNEKEPEQAWKASVGTITGLVAKENVVGTFGVLFGQEEVSENGDEIWTEFGNMFSPMAAYSFLLFNLLCAPCFAAIGAIKREMGNWKWTGIAVGYQTLFAYGISFIFYQLGKLFTGGGFGFATVLAFLLLAGLIYLIVRKPSNPNKPSKKKSLQTA